MINYLFSTIRFHHPLFPVVRRGRRQKTSRRLTKEDKREDHDDDFGKMIVI